MEESDYSGEKLAPDSSLHSMFSNFTKLRLVHLIKQRHKENQEARIKEQGDLHRTLTSAPVKFQWNQVGGPMSVGGPVEEE
jgi:hypothetical protein